MNFWDSSALLPLCREEPHTRALESVVRTDGSIVVWWGTTIECVSGLERQVRTGKMTSLEMDQALSVFEALKAAWSEVEPSEQLRDTALRMLRIHPLGASDALQLAAAWSWVGANPSGLGFVTLDLRLADAARKEGFLVLTAPGKPGKSRQ